MRSAPSRASHDAAGGAAGGVVESAPAAPTGRVFLLHNDTNQILDLQGELAGQGIPFTTWDLRQVTVLLLVPS